MRATNATNHSAVFRRRLQRPTSALSAVITASGTNWSNLCQASYYNTFTPDVNKLRSDLSIAPTSLIFDQDLACNLMCQASERAPGLQVVEFVA
jgi:hypothetical protein